MATNRCTYQLLCTPLQMLHLLGSNIPGNKNKNNKLVTGRLDLVIEPNVIDDFV